jgi:uncharacterized membrane protein
MQKKTLRICLVAMLCALSAVGAQIKIFSSVAFDSMPAFLAAMLLGAPEGAVVGAVGHLLTAALSGFPYTLPLHIVIAAEMALICFAVGIISVKFRRPYWFSGIVAFVLNAFAAPLILLVWPGMGPKVCAVLLLPLTLGAAANALCAVLLACALKKPLAAVINGKAGK